MNFSPRDAEQVADIVRQAVAAGTTLEIVGGGSKRGIGQPSRADAVLDLSAIAGIVAYQPAELVLTARAGTSMAEIEAVLEGAHQMLAFEPPDWRALLGTGGCTPTLGGVVSCNLGGSRRIQAGAARDHVLGFHAVNGRGEVFKAGGRVVKNVTGYDLSKLVTGAYGTLGVLTEISIKVLPRPEHSATVLVQVAPGGQWQSVLAEGVNSVHEITAAAYLPGLNQAALRVEGPQPSTRYRSEGLATQLSVHGRTDILPHDASRIYWRELRDATSLVGCPVVWRIGCTPSRAPEIVAALQPDRWFADWGGGLIWAALDRDAAAIRAVVQDHGGGFATLLHGPAALRAAVAVFDPLPGPLAALSARVKAAFDPRDLFNPGRMTGPP